MKLLALKVEQFQKIREVDVTLTNPIALFAGDNDVGKSTMQDAIRLAFLGESTRVDKKKHFHQLVRRGAQSGSAVIDFIVEANGPVGRASVTVPSGKVDVTRPVPAELPFVLDAGRFAGMDSKDRRKFLFDLMGVRVGPEDVKTRMQDRGCRKDLIDAVAPHLRAGFGAAEEWATQCQTNHRANWRAITGEDYGDKKGEKWSAEKVFTEDNRKALAGILQTLANLTKERAALETKIATANAYLTNKERYEREAAPLRKKSDQVVKLKKDWDAAERAVRDFEGPVEEQRAKLTDARQASQPCPSCGSLLGQKNGKLIEVTAPPKGGIAALEAGMQKMEAALAALRQTRDAIKAQFDEADRASKTLASLETAVGTPASSEELEAHNANLSELQGEIADLEAKRDELRNAEAEAERAQKATEGARREHELVRAWGVVRAAVAQDGIPAEFLAETLDPINKRLQQASRLTGWPLPQLEKDMTILVNGVPYGLCGESVRWRADAMFAEAISHKAGIRMLILDRIDVLAPARRGALLDWCENLANQDGYETILLFGTMKGRPELEGIDVFWLADGVVVQA